jgi:hypothetical protein
MYDFNNVNDEKDNQTNISHNQNVEGDPPRKEADSSMFALLDQIIFIIVVVLVVTLVLIIICIRRRRRNRRRMLRVHNMDPPAVLNDNGEQNSQNEGIRNAQSNIHGDPSENEVSEILCKIKAIS